MSKQTDSLYDNIEFIPDEPSDNPVNSDDSVKAFENGNVIKDKENSQGFDVDWDTIEDNYRQRHHHRHHSTHSSHHSEHSHHSSGSHHSDHSHRSESSEHSDKRKKQGAEKSSSKKEKKKKWSIKKKIFVGILLFLLCIIIGIISAFFIMRYMGKQAMLNYDNLNVSVPDGIDYKEGGRLVYYNGHTYEFNKSIATILFMGIDKKEFDDRDPNSHGQADALYLLTYNTTTGKIRVLALNRDTITDISRYDVEGNYYDTSPTQLCLAYAYGDGKELSAENQLTAVERLIYNVPINAYYAIDLSAIKILNDDIGGVTLTPEYTFGSFTKGQQITIKGDMAEEFVRHRDVSQLDDNLRRMACQRQYINAFANQIVPAIKDNLTLPLDLYNDSSKYTVTNIDTSKLTYLASSLATSYSGIEFITTSGKYEMVEGDTSAQFIIDKNKLFETVLDLFYTKIQ